MNLCVYHRSIFLYFAFCKYKKCFHYARSFIIQYYVLCIICRAQRHFHSSGHCDFILPLAAASSCCYIYRFMARSVIQTIQQIQIHNWQVQILKVQSSFITFVTIISLTKDFGEKKWYKLQINIMTKMVWLWSSFKLIQEFLVGLNVTFRCMELCDLPKKIVCPSHFDVFRGVIHLYLYL